MALHQRLSDVGASGADSAPPCPDGQPPPASDAPRLTPRQIAVLALARQGLTASAIAHRLAISERTVHKHLQQAYARLDVSNRVSAVIRAQSLGILMAER